MVRAAFYAIIIAIWRLPAAKGHGVEVCLKDCVLLLNMKSRVASMTIPVKNRLQHFEDFYSLSYRI